MQGCFLDAGSVGNGLDWQRLVATLDDWQWHHHTSPEQIAERIAGMQVVVTNKVVIDAETIAQSPALELICIAATGVDNVDLQAAAERDIPVVNVAGYATPAVSQHVLALMLGHATRWADYDQAVKRGGWAASDFFCMHDFPIVELDGRALGLVGYGVLGSAVARLAEAFGMTVLVSERPQATHIRDGRVSFDDMLTQTDFISLHCPLTDDTRHLINADVLRRMKPNAMLINTARGGIVDSDALIAALRAGDIGAAAIDVLDKEPPAADHPLLAGDIPNLIVTPHTAWASRNARQRMLDGVAANIESARRGEYDSRVN